MRKRLALTVALFHEAGKCLINMPLLLIQPLWTFVILGLFFIYWVIILAYIGTAGQLAAKLCQKIVLFNLSFSLLLVDATLDELLPHSLLTNVCTRLFILLYIVRYHDLYLSQVTPVSAMTRTSQVWSTTARTLCATCGGITWLDLSGCPSSYWPVNSSSSLVL